MRPPTPTATAAAAAFVSAAVRRRAVLSAAAAAAASSSSTAAAADRIGGADIRRRYRPLTQTPASTDAGGGFHRSRGRSWRASATAARAGYNSQRRRALSASALPDSPPPPPSPPTAAPLGREGAVHTPPTKEPRDERRRVLPPPSAKSQYVSEIMSTPDRTLYERLVRRLYTTNLFHPVKLGLKNIDDLHRAIGSPMDDPSMSIVHIAGTNGKGSVAIKIARSLELASSSSSSSSGSGPEEKTATKKNRVGLFVSPHVSSFRERMSVNGAPITEREVERLLPRIYDACETNSIPATFFEITAALAFLFFAESGCDAVVLETGLGGRLDATNVIKTPRVCVITSIGLEHTRILGSTVEEIAMEKGGIIKGGRPVLVGPNCPHDTLRVCAEERGAGGYYTCGDVLGVAAPPSSSVEGRGDYDAENARIASAALELLRREEEEEGTDRETEGGGPRRRRLVLPSADEIRRGASVRPPCRFERVRVRLGGGGGGGGGDDDDDDGAPQLVVADGDGAENDGGGGGRRQPGDVSVVLDVAHNPDAMRHLANKLRADFPPGRKMRIVAGFSSDKDLGACGSSLLSMLGDDDSKGDNGDGGSGEEGRPPSPSSTRRRRLHLVEASHPRAARAEDVLSASPRLREYIAADSSSTNDDRSVASQVKSALRLASVNEDEVLIVCGSVFIMSEARRALGYDEPRDTEYIAEVAGSNLRAGQENFGNVDPEKKKKVV